MVMQPDNEVTLETPGGGGYGQPTNSHNDYGRKPV
jgi:N-methylhydantoinase B/oxoprolinase/acetone carboxylase alpha subunit